MVPSIPTAWGLHAVHCRIGKKREGGGRWLKKKEVFGRKTKERAGGWSLPPRCLGCQGARWVENRGQGQQRPVRGSASYSPRPSAGWGAWGPCRCRRHCWGRAQSQAALQGRCQGWRTPQFRACRRPRNLGRLLTGATATAAAELAWASRVGDGLSRASDAARRRDGLGELDARRRAD